MSRETVRPGSATPHTLPHTPPLTLPLTEAAQLHRAEERWLDAARARLREAGPRRRGAHRRGAER